MQLLKKLNNGVKIPQIGLGTYQLEFQLDPAVSMADFFNQAFQVGYRHIDTAIEYRNEHFVGQAIDQNIKQGEIKREDLFLTSKIFPHYGNVVENAKVSCKKLRTDYIDLYLLHWPATALGEDGRPRHRPVHQIWKEMEEAVNLGLVKSIGVSNLNVQMLFDLLTYCNIKPVTNQVELNVYIQQPELLRFMREFDIAATAFSPLGQGREVFSDPTLTQLAIKYSKSPAQIMLNFLVKNLDAIVIPKAIIPAQLRDNFDILDFDIEEDDVQLLRQLDRNLRLIDPAKRADFGNFPLFS